MLFNSYIFLVFLVIVLPIFYLLPKKIYKNLFLLVASYFFYGYWDWRFCFLLAISTVVDFFIGLIMERTENQTKRKVLLLISMCVNLGILGFFKYFNFFIDSFSAMAGIFGLNLDYLHLNIILPVGISFYTFQTMSYTIDIYRKKLKATHNFIDFALFVSFFPQLVAGPIERAAHLLPQLTVKLKPSRDQVKKGIVLIVTGMFKKVMIGDTAGRLVDHILSQQEYYVSVELLCALVLFSLQIYADFSGYSSIARGTSKLLGIELMKNFEQPYLSSNITEFWRRWHISLSSWLKDYLYISLGGNRLGKIRTYINLFATMLLGGLWHGASWNFVIWGGLHGLYLAVHKIILGKKKIKGEYNYTGVMSLITYVLKVLMTYILVLFTWLFFRLKTFNDVVYFFTKMIHWERSEYALRFVVITLSFAAMTFLFDFFQYYTKKHTFILLARGKAVKAAILAALLLVTLFYMLQATPLPFIYFQF